MTTDKQKEYDITEFRESLIAKSIFLNWFKKLLIYCTAGSMTGIALSVATIGSLILANVLTISFFTVTPVFPILIIAGAGAIAFLTTAVSTTIKDKLNFDPKDTLKTYEELETNKDGKTYIEIYFEKNNRGKKLKNQENETIKNIFGEWNCGMNKWKENKENKKNWEELYNLKHNNQKQLK